MTNGAASPALPGALRVMKRASTAPVGDWFDLGKHLLRITVFLALAILVYSPMGGSWIHIPAAPMTREGWAAINYTAAAWDTDNWDWDVIDCIYFAMVTMTTVGYGDNPTLRQEMRLFTLFFGFVGVTVVAGSINVIADHFSEIGRKRFIARQRVLLQEANLVASLVTRKRDDPADPPAGAAELSSSGKQGEKSASGGSGGFSGRMSSPAGAPEALGAIDAAAMEKAAAPMAVVDASTPRSGASGGMDGSHAGGADPPPSAPPTPPPLEPSAADGSGEATGSLPPSPPETNFAPVAAHPKPPRRKSRENQPEFHKTPSKLSQVMPTPNGDDGRPPEVQTEGASFGEGGASSPTGRRKALWDRLPSRKMVCRVLKALRLTGLFFLLSILLGEIENAAVADCGFGWGWSCGFAYSCEMGKAGVWDTDVSGFTDRSHCWSWIDQLYWATMTLVTIGYGDVAPHSKGGKLFAALMVTFAVFCFTTLLAELVEIRQSKRLGAEKTLRERLGELKEVIDQDDDGTVTPEEYIIFNLKKMGKVDDETLALLKDQFSALDADGSGELDADDIDMLTNACEVLEQEDKVGAPSSARIGAMSPAAAVSLTGKRSPGMAPVAAPVASKPA